MDPLAQYGVALGGAILIISILGVAIRILWQQARQDQTGLIEKLQEQFASRLSDKNAELSQVWTELRTARDEVRIVRAEKEWLERMNDRGDDMLKTALEELRLRRR